MWWHKAFAENSMSMYQQKVCMSSIIWNLINFFYVCLLMDVPSIISPYFAPASPLHSADELRNESRTWQKREASASDEGSKIFQVFIILENAGQNDILYLSSMAISNVESLTWKAKLSWMKAANMPHSFPARVTKLLCSPARVTLQNLQ